jgi:hypothetical protein
LPSSIFFISFHISTYFSSICSISFHISTDFSSIFSISYLDEGYEKICLIRYHKTFIFWYQDLVEIYSLFAETIINDAFSHRENV